MMTEYNDNHLKRKRSRKARFKRANSRLRAKLGQYRTLTLFATGAAVVLATLLGFIAFDGSGQDAVLLGRGKAGVMTRADSVRMADSLRVADAQRVADSTRVVDSVATAAGRAAEQAQASTEKGRTVGAGEASYYGEELAGQPTASGERFNPGGLTAAHRTLPLGSRLRVTNVRTGKSVIVRVNDRGPFSGNRVIDLSKGAAQRIGMLGSGTAMVRMELLTRR